MRDRYSIVVGLLFLVLVAIATIHTLSGGGGEERSGSIASRRAGRCRSSRCRPPPVRWKATRTSPRTTANRPPCPCPAGTRRHPACRISTAGAIRVCDLFGRPLVISFWFTKGGDCADQQDAVDAVYRRYRGRVNFLSLDVRDDRDTVRELIREHGWEMPVGYDRDGAVASLYRVGGCPTFAYVYPGGTLQSAGIGDLTAPQLGGRVRRLLERDRGGGSGLRWPPGDRARGLGWDPAPQRGWVSPHIAAEFPGLGSRLGRGRGTAGPQPRPGPPPPARALRPLLRLARDPDAGTADSLGLPRLLPPDRARPGPDPDAGRAARARPPPRRRLRQPRPARRRADDRHRRDRRRAARLRRRPPRRPPLHSRLGAGRVAGRAARRARAGNADARRRVGPGRPAVRGDRGGLRGRACQPRGSRSSRSRSTACPQIAVEEALWMAAAELSRA